MTDRHTPPSTELRESVEAMVGAWLAEQLAENPVVDSVELDTSTDVKRWAFGSASGAERW